MIKYFADPRIVEYFRLKMKYEFPKHIIYLTKVEVEMAKLIGMTLREYAMVKKELMEDGRL